MTPTTNLTDQQVVITDANVLINFIHLKQLELLNRLPRHRFSIPDQVVDEVTHADQATALAKSFECRHLDRCNTSETAASELFDVLSEKIESGEAACIAIAAAGGHSVATDERRHAERFAKQLLGAHRLLRTETVLGRCIEHGVITVEEADEFKAQLELKRYKMNFDSFADLIPS
ncbi:hypothetical protein [Mitsuaria sp. GD03876]|uniref:hypothetical protein n=1 Tax=Mitsuaria sp. GD03876 TaxID=2975399 RepID=UPI00244C2D51|nr:hypothetical protein [Mitsuaria sp. GD03876]MDH0864008.1 hypothetical protein [Mitsuaria sp. GD03876]